MTMILQESAPVALPDPAFIVLAIVAVSAAVAALVAILRARRLEDDGFGGRRPKRSDAWLEPDDEKAEDPDGDKAYATRESAFWSCSACDTVFETDGAPVACPCCGLPLLTGFDGADARDEAYVCPEHGPFVIVDDDGNTCPVCGRPSVHAAIAERHHARWECSACETEFTVPDGFVPKECPACGAEFPPSHIKNEEKKAYECSACGKTFVMFDDVPDRCPYCGKRISSGSIATEK